VVRYFFVRINLSVNERVSWRWFTINKYQKNLVKKAKWCYKARPSISVKKWMRIIRKRERENGIKTYL
jgi:hypothetical protein